MGLFDDYYDSYSDSEQILLEMCPFYGVDEEDIILLLDYGYSCSEIEELLFETDELHEILRAVRSENNYGELIYGEVV